MYLPNDYLKRDLFVTPHARNRFFDRGGDSYRSLAERLKRALPFGAQLGGDCCLLEDGGLVFAVRQNRVTTVMTKEQATANVQAICKDHSRRVMRHLNGKKKWRERRQAERKRRERQHGDEE